MLKWQVKKVGRFSHPLASTVIESVEAVYEDYDTAMIRAVALNREFDTSRPDCCHMFVGHLEDATEDEKAMRG